MKRVGKNNLLGEGGRVPCPFPSEGVRTHPEARGKELKAPAASTRSWQRAVLWRQSRSPGALRRLGQGSPARLPYGERPSLPLPSCLLPQRGTTPAPGQPREACEHGEGAGRREDAKRRVARDGGGSVFA